MRTCFSIKKPNKTRRSFAIVKDVIRLDGTREQTQVKDDTLDSLNRNLHAGLINIDEALVQLKTVIKPRLEKLAGITDRVSAEMSIGEHNRKVFYAFWDKEYKKKDLIAPKSSSYDLLAALKRIEPLALATETQDRLQAKLKPLPPKKHRRTVMRLNQLLTFLGRGFTLSPKKPQFDEVSFVTWEELQKILPHIYSEDVRNLAIALWGTGVRLGEAFAPGFTRIRPNQSLFINKQMDRELVVRDIKNRKPHTTVLIAAAKAGYEAWCAVENKEKYRITATNQIIVASREAFPTRKDKQISPHDLRHSYAIELLARGGSLTQVATCLGDSITTVQEHYAGFVMSDAAIEGLAKLLK